MDRNTCGLLILLIVCGSLSARRAWIEITYSDGVVSGSGVALRKESVDRNKWDDLQRNRHNVALRKESVDRNGLLLLTYHLKYGVALRKESVDRNLYAVQIIVVVMRRSPQGERG